MTLNCNLIIERCLKIDYVNNVKLFPTHTSIHIREITHIKHKVSQTTLLMTYSILCCERDSYIPPCQVHHLIGLYIVYENELNVSEP